jgi:catechol 2,3-dioxygenase-like lactoylglutathione lyase family enzyme
MIKTRGLKHINLNVSNLDRSLAFYQKIFGLEIEFRHGNEMIFLHTPGSHDLIALCQAKQGDHLGLGGISHVGWEIERESDLDKVEREIGDAGGKLVSRGHHGPGEPFLYFEDPDGYLVELFGKGLNS